jgi:hypothetical protein
LIPFFGHGIIDFALAMGIKVLNCKAVAHNKHTDKKGA